MESNSGHLQKILKMKNSIYMLDTDLLIVRAL